MLSLPHRRWSLSLSYARSTSEPLRRCAYFRYRPSAHGTLVRSPHRGSPNGRSDARHHADNRTTVTHMTMRNVRRLRV